MLYFVNGVLLQNGNALIQGYSNQDILYRDSSLMSHDEAKNHMTIV